MALNTVFISLLRLMSISVGGLSATEQTAVAVIPQRPAGPLLVITLDRRRKMRHGVGEGLLPGSELGHGE